LLKSRSHLGTGDIPEPKSALVPLNKKASMLSADPIKEEEDEDEDLKTLDNEVKQFNKDKSNFERDIGSEVQDDSRDKSDTL